MGVIKTEYYDGSDCTESSGDLNRVLTISNTSTTTVNGFLIYVSGLALALTSEYTIIHNPANSVVTFINRVWDDQKIIVQYIQDGSSIIESDTSEDFILGPIGDFGVQVVRTSVTITTDFHGDKTYINGTNETIEVVFENPNKKYELDESGLDKSYDAKIFIKSAQILNKYDKITYESNVYRVETVSIRNFNGTAMFKMATLFFIE